MAHQLTRRTVAQGIAWSIPAVAAAAAAPLVAASPLSCPTNAEIDALFAQRRTEVSAYDGCAGTTEPTFTIWYDGAGGSNGYLQNSFINVRNQNPCAIDTTKYPLAFRIDIANVSGPDTDENRPGVLQRSLTNTNSYGYVAPWNSPAAGSAGIKNETNFRARSREELTMADGTVATRTVYSANWNIVRAPEVNAGEDIDIQFSWADGLDLKDGRIRNVYRLVPLGLAAPEWSELTVRSSADCPDAYAHFLAKTQEWYDNGYGCSPNITWEVATNVTATNFDTTSGYTRTEIECGTGIWSNVAKDFTPAHDGIY